MGQLLQEKLTIQFYDWERRGRGWYVFSDPIHLEPEYIPFFGHFLLEQERFVDDALRKTIFQRALDALRPKPKENQQEPEFSYDEVNAYPFDEDSPLAAYRITIPKNHKVGVDQMEALLLMLSNTECPVSFEILGNGAKIHIQFVCRSIDAYIIKSQLNAFFPEIILSESPEYLEDIVSKSGYAFVTDFGLREEFMRPLEMDNNFKLDPFTPIFGILDSLKENEHVALQVLFTKVVNPWGASMLRSVKDGRGDSFFLDAPEMVKLAEKKVSSPLFAATVRVLTQSDNEKDALQLLKHVSSAVMHSSGSAFNSLIPLDTELYDFNTRLEDIYERVSHRIGMIFNARELLSFVHIPNESITSKKLDRGVKKTNPAPSVSGGEYIVLGNNEHQGKIMEVRVPVDDRLKHTHIIGGTGTGKSTLILQLIKQDIEAGRGVCVLDPHGDLIESVISLIPKDRISDVLVIDPADADFPVSFNIMEAHSDIEKEILSSDLVGGFKRLSTSWGDQMNSVLANAILAFLESDRGGTLTDLRRFLIEKEFRNDFLKTVRDPSIQYYWLKEYPLLKSNSIGSILTRLDTFLRPKVIRNMVAQKKGINFEHLINSNKIIVVKLSQGLIGVENSYLLGTFVVSKIHQAVMARQAMEKEARNNFFLYIDEFQNFITPSMSAILSGARKYHLGLVLAHQDLAQLIKNDSELASSVLTNAGTRICFRLSDTDAKRLSEGFSHFESVDLQNLGVGEAIARIGKPDNDFNLETNRIEKRYSNHQDQIITSSRNQYASRREEVEASLLQSYEGVVTSQPEVKVAKKEVIPLIEEVIPSPEPTVEVQNDSLKESVVKRQEQSRHRYLQTLIKRMAEQRGYKALIEEDLPDKSGRVDVHIEGQGKKIACEVTVTTTNEWELHNIEKCLKAGYDFVFECASDKKNMEGLVNLVKENINPNYYNRILIGEPEALFEFLDSIQLKQDDDKPKETTIKGYRVKIEYDQSTSDDIQKKKESIAKIVMESLQKKKK